MIKVLKMLKSLGKDFLLVVVNFSADSDVPGVEFFDFWEGWNLHLIYGQAISDGPFFFCYRRRCADENGPYTGSWGP